MTLRRRPQTAHRKQPSSHSWRGYPAEPPRSLQRGPISSQYGLEQENEGRRGRDGGGEDEGREETGKRSDPCNEARQLFQRTQPNCGICTAVHTEGTHTKVINYINCISQLNAAC